MLETIFYAILLLLTVLGVVFCAREFMLLLLVPPKRKGISIVIPISGHSEDIEYTVMCVVKRNRWFDRFKNANIILLDCGIDEDTRQICVMLCKRFKELKMAQAGELEQVLSQLNQADAAVINE